MQLYTHKVACIVSDYEESVEEFAPFYEDSGDSDSDQSAATTAAEAEERQLLVAQELYDDYATLVSSAVLSAPVLSELKFNEYEQVLFVPCSSVNRDGLMHRSERSRFNVIHDTRVRLPT